MKWKYYLRTETFMAYYLDTKCSSTISGGRYLLTIITRLLLFLQWVQSMERWVENLVACCVGVRGSPIKIGGLLLWLIVITILYLLPHTANGSKLLGQVLELARIIEYFQLVEIAKMSTISSKNYRVLSMDEDCQSNYWKWQELPNIANGQAPRAHNLWAMVCRRPEVLFRVMPSCWWYILLNTDSVLKELSNTHSNEHIASCLA